MLFLTDKAAAVPAACPVTKHGGITLNEPAASCVAETHLPPTRRLFIFAGRSIL